MLHGLLAYAPIGELLLQIGDSHVVRDKDVGGRRKANQTAQGGSPKPALATFGGFISLNVLRRRFSILELIHLGGFVEFFFNIIKRNTQKISK